MLQRAVLAIIRRPAKTATFFLTVFITLSLILAGFSTWDTANRAIASLRTAFPAYIQVSGDEPLDLNSQNALSGIQGVDEVVVIQRQLLHAGELNVVPGLYTHGGDTERAKDLGVIAVSQSKYYSDFIYRLLILSEGRHIDIGDTGVVLISEELARRNGLSLGDAVVLSAIDSESQAVLEVIGIFECVLEQEVSVKVREYEIQDNLLFTDNATVQSMAGDERHTSAMLIVRDAAMLGEVTQNILQLGGGRWDEKSIAVNNNAYETVGPPLERLSSLTQILILAVAGIGILILTLTLLLWIRGRKSETGILLSIGLRKKEIVGQYWLEAIGITLLAFLTVCGIGGILTGVFRSASMNMPGADIPFSVTLPSCLYTLATSIAIVTIAVILAAVPVLRMKPIKILSSGN